MSYVRNIALKYENETQFGLKTTVEVKHSTDEPTGGLAYITNDDQKRWFLRFRPWKPPWPSVTLRVRHLSIPSNAVFRFL